MELPFEIILHHILPNFSPTETRTILEAKPKTLIIGAKKNPSRPYRCRKIFTYKTVLCVNECQKQLLTLRLVSRQFKKAVEISPLWKIILANQSFPVKYNKKSNSIWENFLSYQMHKAASKFNRKKAHSERWFLFYQNKVNTYQAQIQEADYNLQMIKNTEEQQEERKEEEKEKAKAEKRKFQYQKRKEEKELKEKVKFLKKN